MRLVPCLALSLLLTACQDGGTPEVVAPVADPSALPPIESLDGGVWMKGDLHLHSQHSSDAADHPMAGLVALAETVGMDYFLVTDHDSHVEGDVATHTWADPDYRSASMVLLYGAEWTTHRGHGNTISARPYDHRSFYAVRDELDTVIAAKARELGFHFSANHPSGGDSWDFSYDMVRSLEVWNSSIWSRNAGALIIWDDLLKSGRRLAGRGGSDSHHSFSADPATWTANVFESAFNDLGTPTTWVYARERSAEGVVRGLDSGRVAVSAAPGGARVEFYADRDGDGAMDMMMGDVAKASGQPVNFRVDIVGGEAQLGLYTVKVVKDGAEFGSYQSAGASVSFSDTPVAGQRSYYRVEVQGLPAPYPQVPGAALLSAGMVGLSNPIYFDFYPKQ